LGDIGVRGGGICGETAGYLGTASITNCYSEGEISQLAGGICGENAGREGLLIISNSYSLGLVLTGAGGICGENTGENSNVLSNISNCYSLNASSTQIIGDNGDANFTILNSYGANGTWSSTDANGKLTGIPTVQPNVGPTWSYYIEDTPYILTVFLKTTLIYTINSTSTGAQLESIIFSINEPIINVEDIVNIDGNDYSVTTVNANLFTNNANVTNITIPETVTSILGDDIFSGCSALTDVSVGLVTSLGNNTFKDCISLLNVILPDTMTSMGDNTFDGCLSLEYVSLGLITTISDNTFNGCTALKRFNIPGTVHNLYSPNLFGISTLSGAYFQGSGIYSGPMFFNFSLI